MFYSFFFVFSASLSELKQDLKQSWLASYSRGSWANMYIQWKSYWLFCRHYGLRPLPASAKCLFLFAQFLSRSFKSADSINNYLCSVKVLHEISGLECDVLQSSGYKLLIRGLRRQLQHRSKEALPVDPQLLKEMFVFVDVSDVTQATYWCAILFAFFLMFRKSQYISQFSSVVDMSKVLRSDVVISDDVAKVYVGWSKTNQFGQRLLCLPLVSIPNSPLCPLTAFEHMSRMLPLQAHFPAFMVLNRGHLQPLSYPAFQAYFRCLISLTGRDSGEFSTHSLHRGGASWAYRNNVDVDLIQLHGDWASDCYKKYLHVKFPQKVKLVSAMVQVC